ncbi:MAG: tetratricopeptide repeat protein [Acidobacteria bacterium]|nr:tetratricopeptide repeat protein [Acidobacteriota bacterium]
MLGAAALLAALLGQAPLEEAIADFRAGRFREAERKFIELLKQDPGRAVVWKGLGAVYAAEGQLERSLPCFERACQLDPKEEDACYYLGGNLYTKGRFEAALEALEKALKAGPETKLWRIHRTIAQSQGALGRAEEAERSFQQAIRLSRGQARPDEDPRIDYGIFLYRQARTQEALGPLEEAVKAHPKSARAHNELGRVLLQLGRVKEAAGQLEKAVGLDAKLWNAHLLLGQAYLRLGRRKEGQRHLEIGEKGLAGEGYGAARER